MGTEPETQKSAGERKEGSVLRKKSIRAINGFMKTVSAIMDHLNEEGSSVFQA